MIVENRINDELIERYSDDPSKMLHKIGTDEYYMGAVDLFTSPYEYEEVDNPDYDPGDSDSDSDSDIVE